MKYKSVKEMKKYLKKRTLLDEIIYYGFYFWRNSLVMLPRRIYWFFQRGFRGFGDNDTWDFDDYLGTMIAQGLRHLKYFHGINPTKKELDTIIKGFEANLKMIHGNINPKSKKYIILKLKFHRGMQLFEKYFNNLWD